MSPVWDDPRVARGMEAQLRARRERIDAGERPVGWKVGFGAPAAKQNLGIEAPLVGFLTDRGLVEDGALYSIAGWTKPALEPEIAVHMGSDLPAGADREAAAGAIGGLGPAIELADLDMPLDDLEAVVAGNIFQRGFVLGPADGSRAGGSADGLVATIHRNGAELARTDEPLMMVGGELVDVTRHVADLLGAAGERLRAGEVIITGSVVPLIWPEPGDEIRYELVPLGELSVGF
jgi:2-keto-4-pentenoate hydratase